LFLAFRLYRIAFPQLLQRIGAFCRRGELLSIGGF